MLDNEQAVLSKCCDRNRGMGPPGGSLRSTPSCCGGTAPLVGRPRGKGKHSHEGGKHRRHASLRGVSTGGRLCRSAVKTCSREREPRRSHQRFSSFPQGSSQALDSKGSLGVACVADAASRHTGGAAAPLPFNNHPSSNETFGLRLPINGL